MADIKKIFDKTKELAGKAKDAVVDASKAGADFVQTKVDEFKQNKETKKQNAIDDYLIEINEAKEKIENAAALEFIERLGQSVIVLNHQNAEKIKKVFPIPVEQTILWADAEFDLRPSGVAVTESGVFIKTDITIKEEKIDKERISELVYYKWSQFNPEWLADDEDKDNKLMLVDEKCIRRFYAACLKQSNALVQRRAELEMKSERLFYRDTNVVNASAVTSGGIALSGIETITRNQSAANTATGHGIMAEHANTLNDILHFKNAQVVGGDNAKNGPDRLVNGTNIQTKYCKTGARSVGAAFDNAGDGTYRYLNKDGSLMKLEVPSDQYESALNAMQKKIDAGKVLVSDGEGNKIPFNGNADEIVTKGHYSYEQALNLAKAGTIESIKYDVETGAIVGLGVFGITFLINSYLSYRTTKDMGAAVMDGLAAGGKSGLLAVGNHVAISQLSRTALFKDILSKNVIKSGVATGVVSLLVFSIPETYKLATKKISVAQYAVNLLSLGASIAGGMVGSMVGTTVASNAGATALAVGAAGAAAGIAGGIAIGALVTTGLSIAYEGDDAIHTRLFNAITCSMMSEYLFTGEEMDQFIQTMNAIPAKKFKELYDKLGASRHQEKVVRDFLTPFFEAIASNREKLPFDPYGVELLEAE